MAQAGAAVPGTGDRDLAAEAKPGAYSWYVVIVLMLAYALSFIDRKLPFILVEAIKADLGLSDTQIGLLTGAMFALVYSTVAIPIAALADRHSRKNIIASAVFIWSGLTALGGFAQNFWHLAFSRMGVAVGEAACTPAAHSIIAGYFPQRFRARAFGVYFVGAQIGILVGLSAGGWINDMANWRWAMFLLGAPGVALTLLIFFTVKEPPREAPKADASKEKAGFFEAIKVLFRKGVFVHLMLAAVLFIFTSGAVQAFAPAYVMRTFELSASQTGLSYGLVMAAGGVTGALLGGVVGDRLRKVNPPGALLFVAAMIGLGVPCLVYALYTDMYWLFLVLIFLTQVGGMSYAGPSFATIQSLIPARMHAMASAIYLFALSGIGLSLGPVAAGMLSDHLNAIGNSNPLRWALIIMVIPKLLAAVHYVFAARSLKNEASIAAAG